MVWRISVMYAVLSDISFLCVLFNVTRLCLFKSGENRESSTHIFAHERKAYCFNKTGPSGSSVCGWTTITQRSGRGWHLLTKSDGQTEDGHAMMKLSPFWLIPDLEARSAWMLQNCQYVRANLKAYMCVSQETSRWGKGWLWGWLKWCRGKLSRIRLSKGYLLLFPAPTLCHTSLLSNFSCRALSFLLVDYTCRFATNFHKSVCSCCEARYPCFHLVRYTPNSLSTIQCLAMSREAPSSTTTNTSLPYAKTVSGSTDALASDVKTWNLSLCPQVMTPSTPSVVVLIILPPSVHVTLLCVK